MPTPDESDDAAAVRRADAERRRREDKLLLLLLLLLGKVQRAAALLTVHGLPVAGVIRSMLAGNPATGNAGAAPIIARTMAQAHRDGFRRAGLMAGIRTVARDEAGKLADLIETYRPAAQRAADAMADTLNQAVALAVGIALAEGDTGAALRRVVREAFETAGYDRSNPYAVDLGAERAVVTAHNAGILAAAGGGAEALRGVVTGLAHRSVLDSATTDICRERDGLQLPIDDPYWTVGRGVPALHFRCRSVLQPLTGDFDVSTWRPTIPPMPGFGYSPVPFLQTVP